MFVLYSVDHLAGLRPASRRHRLCRRRARGALAHARLLPRLVAVVRGAVERRPAHGYPVAVERGGRVLVQKRSQVCGAPTLFR